MRRFDEICDEISTIISGLDFPRPRRVRSPSVRQRDVTKNLRAAKAAGLDVREIAPDGRVILGNTQAPEPSCMAKNAADVVLNRLRLVHGSR